MNFILNSQETFEFLLETGEAEVSTLEGVFYAGEGDWENHGGSDGVMFFTKAGLAGITAVGIGYVNHSVFSSSLSSSLMV
jgi:hypothetical protein